MSNPEAWAREHVQATGPGEVALVRPWATVRRVPVAGGRVWLKECAPVQAFEPSLTAALAARWPDRLPQVIAHDARRGLLLLEDAGEPLGIGGDPEPWLEVLPRYAQLQIGEAARAGDHLRAGVPDRRLERFPALLEAALARGLPLPARDLARLRAFAPRFAELCAELAAAGIPETNQHDDLHGANVYRRGGGVRILDWGDSCIAHPFLTARVTLVHLFLERDDACRARLRDAYLEPFGRPAELRGAFELAQRLAPFAHLFVLLRVLATFAATEHALFVRDLGSTLAECLDVAA